MAILSSLFFLSCSSSSSSSKDPKVYAPDDMPDICKDIDFNQSGDDLKELCGVQTRNYKAYRNIPEHRNLLLPKGSRIVHKGKTFELRLQNTLPISLPDDLEGSLQFDEKMRRNLIKSKMDYCEFFPENSSDRLKIFSLEIPLDIGGSRTFCFSVQGHPTTAQRNAGYAGHLEALSCTDFQKLKALAEGQAQGQNQGQNQVQPPTQSQSQVPSKDANQNSGAAKTPLTSPAPKANKSGAKTKP